MIRKEYSKIGIAAVDEHHDQSDTDDSHEKRNLSKDNVSLDDDELIHFCSGFHSESSHTPPVHTDATSKEKEEIDEREK